MQAHLIAPHGGNLVSLMAGLERRRELETASRDWPSWSLTPRQLCDLELLLNGGFSPLAGFMRRADYESVCSSMHLADGTLWPIPVTLDVTEKMAGDVGDGSWIALRDPEGVMCAAMQVEDLWEPDRVAEAVAVFGNDSTEHPGVNHLLAKTHGPRLGGRIVGIQLPPHYDFRSLRLTPEELRAEFTRLGWRRVVGFQTRGAVHRAEHELSLRAAKECRANLLILPAVGISKPDDVDHYTRIRCCQAILPYYPHNTAMLSLLPLATRSAGPREALWHAIIAKNYGCSHFIVGRDHAGRIVDSAGKPFYAPHAASELVRKHETALGVSIAAGKDMFYAQETDTYIIEDKISTGQRILSISTAELKQRLAEGRSLPEWFTFREVARELKKTHPPRHQQGFTVFFTGLSGAGKSTLANVLLVKLLEMGGRPVTLLDGDIVRKNLSSELGFSREHRNINIRRIGFVASEITKNGGIAVCAPIAPYDSVRKEVRHMIEPLGGFIMIHVSTPIEVCERRDRKGMYAKARAGLIKEFTGISDPYEQPLEAEVVIDTTEVSPEEAAQEIILHLERQGFIAALRE